MDFIVEQGAEQTFSLKLFPPLYPHNFNTEVFKKRHSLVITRISLKRHVNLMWNRNMRDKLRYFHVARQKNNKKKYFQDLLEKFQVFFPTLETFFCCYNELTERWWISAISISFRFKIELLSHFNFWNDSKDFPRKISLLNNLSSSFMKVW